MNMRLQHGVGIGLLVLFVLALLPWVARFQPTFVTPAHVDDHVEIHDIQSAETYFGRLENNPHSYTFTLRATSTLRWQLLVPTLQTAQTKPNGLLVRRHERGGVSEVGRVVAADTTWAPYEDQLFNDSYTTSVAHEEVLPPGRYLFEVNTADNASAYVLAVGKETHWSIVDRVAVWGDIWRVKQFVGKPWWAAWESPLYYLPSLAIVIGVSLYYYRSRRYA